MVLSPWTFRTVCEVAVSGPSRPSPSGVTVSCDARGRGAAREDASIRDNEKKVQTRGAGRDPYVEKCYARRAGASERRSTSGIHGHAHGLNTRSYIITLLILCLQRFRRPRKRRRPRRRRTRAARPTQLGSAGRGRCTSPRDTDYRLLIADRLLACSLTSFWKA